MTPIQKTTSILTREGIDISGVCAFERVTGRLIDCGAKSRLPRNAKSVIVCLFPYKTDCGERSASLARNVSRYAVVRDYHEVAGRMLDNSTARLAEEFPGNQFVRFVDNSPIPEVYAANLCGLGVRGDNGLLISEKYGSWVFIGEIVTDLELPQSGQDVAIKECNHCGNCVRACPTGALAAGDMNICLSKISQKKGALTDREGELMRRNKSVWGCDICQEVCPLNRRAADTQIREFLENQVPLVDRNTLLDGRAFAWRGREVLLRNIGFNNPD